MKNKGLPALAFAAIALCAAWWLVSGDDEKESWRSIPGSPVVPGLDVSSVARIELGGKILAEASSGGWIVPGLRGYPADRRKVAENLLKLAGLKAGQVVRGKKLENKTPLVLFDASGKEIARVELGEKHERWDFGRYVEFKGEAVLVDDRLDAFGDDPKSWVETKIIDTPWTSFRDLADETLGDEAFGFQTGATAKVTIAGDTNRVATVGAAVKDGTDRYLKLDGQKWVYTIGSYAADSILPKPPKAGETEGDASAETAEATETTETAETPAPAEAAAPAETPAPVPAEVAAPAPAETPAPAPAEVAAPEPAEVAAPAPAETPAPVEEPAP